jgi:hypothetical protein
MKGVLFGIFWLLADYVLPSRRLSWNDLFLGFFFSILKTNFYFFYNDFIKKYSKESQWVNVFIIII